MVVSRCTLPILAISTLDWKILSAEPSRSCVMVVVAPGSLYLESVVIGGKCLPARRFLLAEKLL